MSTVCTEFVLFNLQIGPYQVLPLWVRVDLQAKAKKGYSKYCKSSRVEPHRSIDKRHIQDTRW